MGGSGEDDVNLLQIQAKDLLPARAAWTAYFLLTLKPAPSLEKKDVNDLQLKPQAPISNDIQWTFHPLDIEIKVFIYRIPGPSFSL